MTFTTMIFTLLLATSIMMVVGWTIDCVRHRDSRVRAVERPGERYAWQRVRSTDWN